MIGNGKVPAYRVIGIRTNGERVIISSHSTREVADKVLKMLVYVDFTDIHVEENSRSKSRDTRMARQ